MQPIKYFNLQKEKQAQARIDAEKNRLQTRHIDFLLQRKRDDTALVMPKREQVVAEDVARIAEKTLQGKSASYYQQLVNWRPDLAFKRFEQVRLIDGLPHLGYAAITQGMMPEADGTETPWILYFANFNARFGSGDILFEDIPIQYGITFFALALTLTADSKVGGRDIRKRGNGLLFSTQDPTDAFENIVKLRDVQKHQARVRRRYEAKNRDVSRINSDFSNISINVPPGTTYLFSV